MTELAPLDAAVLPPGIRARFVDGINGLRMHVLEAGYETPGRPLVLLLHGFPELAWSWRSIMRPLADAGFHVLAPDQRGYGRTSGWSDAYDQDLAPFGMLNLARDALALAFAFGYGGVAAVVGHDFGAAVASWCALTRPDVFERCVIMSAPFAGPPSLPFATVEPAGRASPDKSRAGDDLDAALAALNRPRKHYQRYYTTRPANDDMMGAPGGVSAFLRAYFHHKSADWKPNRPHRLADWSADEIAKMPTYYIMERDQTMAETVAPHRPSAAEIAAMPLADRGGPRRLCGRIWPARLPGRPQLVPGALRDGHKRRAFALRAGGHQGALDVHCRRQRLGRPSGPRRPGENAGRGLQRHARRASGRRRWPLGPAGAAGAGAGAVAALHPAVGLSRDAT